eukprot:evm.model.scf_103EXC.7 EVM.evm.TU.scf_103EXC.7   scf_103EXC:78994-80492(-)
MSPLEVDSQIGLGVGPEERWGSRAPPLFQYIVLSSTLSKYAVPASTLQRSVPYRSATPTNRNFTRMATMQPPSDGCAHCPDANPWAAVKAKLQVFAGRDKCRFRPASPASPIFEAVPSDRVARDLGVILTLGVGGVLGKPPLRRFQLAGVDDRDLRALGLSCGEDALTFDGVMAFLKDRGYDARRVEEDRSALWCRVVVVMRKRGGSWGACGALGRGDAFVRVVPGDGPGGPDEGARGPTAPGLRPADAFIRRLPGLECEAF